MELSLDSLQSGTGKVPVTRKRNRLPISCGHCRRRKQKCNRANPCDACVRSRDAATCSYASDGQRDNETIPPDYSREDNLMVRIDRLEQLLMSVTSSGAQYPLSGAQNALQSTAFSNGPLANLEGKTEVNGSHQTANDAEMGQLAGAFGIMKVDQNPSKSTYLGSAHWLSIMCQIEEFKSYLVENHNHCKPNVMSEQDSSLEITRPSSSLLRGVAPPANRQELLSSLPSRVVVDSLVTQFFKTYSMNSPFIHEPTFRKECLAHWNEPTKTTIIWLGLLYAIIRLGALSSIEAEQNTISDSRGVYGALEEYRKRTIQCLVTADYTNPVAYTIETLLLYIGSEWLTSQDAGIEISLVLGMAVRLAMRMGIHCYSKAHPKITPFQGEMRRRTWATLHEMDIIYSFQLSLPTAIRQGDCDCGMPRNMSDDDFGPDTAELPPPRSSTEATAVSYSITKYRLTLLLGEILALAESRTHASLEEIMKYDNVLQEARRTTPPHLRLPPAGAAATTTNMFLTKQRIGIDRIYQLAQCILHRKFLQRARRDANYAPNRLACIDAAMALLNHQAMIYLECSATYPQNLERRHLSTLSTHDFFVAGVAIALDLYYGYKSGPDVTTTAASETTTKKKKKKNEEHGCDDDIRLWGYDRRPEMITALETSVQFWRICKDYSAEASKAHDIFSFALTKAKKAQWRNIFDAQTGGDAPDIVGGSVIPPETGLSSDWNGMDGVIEQEGFDWNPWNAQSGAVAAAADNEDFESLLNWSPKSPE